MRNRYGVEFTAIEEPHSCEAEVLHGQGTKGAWLERCQYPAKWRTVGKEKRYVCTKHAERIFPHGVIVVARAPSLSDEAEMDQSRPT